MINHKTLSFKMPGLPGLKYRGLCQFYQGLPVQ
jgi:hypothetical protein